MDNDDFLQSKEVKNKHRQIILEVALILNKELFDEKKITYRVYKFTEENILKKIKNNLLEE